ncbi:MAG: hypothetical protein U9Q19_02275, partial [Pseudomonadota bacterium]|nr:hypothetical protein [Pseudomonadota bacterium]
MIQRDSSYTLGGTVETDEILIGGKQPLEERHSKGDNKTPFLIAYSTPSLPLIPEQACHPFQTKAATDSRAKLPPWQIA